jgi:hypothetical protein
MPKYRPEKSVEFINLEGKQVEYPLSDDEQLLSAKCPLDETYLIKILGPYDPYIRCPNCQLIYSRHDLSPEELQEQLKDYLDRFEIELEKLEKQKSSLEKFLNFAKNKISQT